MSILRCAGHQGTEAREHIEDHTIKDEVDDIVERIHDPKGKAHDEDSQAAEVAHYSQSHDGNQAWTVQYLKREICASPSQIGHKEQKRNIEQNDGSAQRTCCHLGHRKSA